MIAIGKTVFLSDVSIRRKLCLKLQKVDKGDGTRNIAIGKIVFLSGV